MKDWIVLGAIAGFAGTLGDEVVHWTAVWSGLAKSTTGHYLSQLIFPHQPVTFPMLLMGELTHLLAGAVLGLVVVLIFMVSGLDYAVIKGAGFGAAMWIVHVVVIPNLVEPRPYIYRTYNEAVVDMLSHLVWGAIAALIIKGYLIIDPETKEANIPPSPSEQAHNKTLLNRFIRGCIPTVLLSQYLKIFNKGKGDR
ncbi:MAG: hypothetical protein ACOWWO_11560 [Peptococcaceae bacterium]